MQVGSASASQSREEFLQLLVAQLRNQDPLEPVKQEDFLAQLAQFSTLEGIENLNSNFESQMQLQRETMLTQQMAQATTLIGQEVSYTNEAGETQSGIIDSVQISADGFSYTVGGESVKSDQLVAIGRVEAETGPDPDSGQPIDEPQIEPNSTLTQQSSNNRKTSSIVP